MNPLNHVAIIMDGNGRWGIKYKNSRHAGHKEGLKVINNIIKLSVEKKIKYLTLFVFSKDNWKRPKAEINYLFNLLYNFLNEKINFLNDNNIKLNIIGNKNFSKKIKKLLIKSENLTKKNSLLQINLALNYGSREEILSSVKKIVKKKTSINDKNLSDNLYTKNIPDPDILIRTGDTRRLSNFLLWQLAYAEIFFEKKLWPDFNEYNYREIIKKYRKIKRNFGKI